STRRADVYVQRYAVGIRGSVHALHPHRALYGTPSLGDAALVGGRGSSRRVALVGAARAAVRPRFQRPPHERFDASWGTGVDSLATPPDVPHTEAPALRDRGAAWGARRAAAHHPDQQSGDDALSPLLERSD